MLKQLIEQAQKQLNQKFTVKQKQYLLGGIVAFVSFIVFKSIFGPVLTPEVKEAKSDGSQVETLSSSALVSEEIDQDKIWRYNLKQENKEIKDSLNLLEETLEVIKQEKEKPVSESGVNEQHLSELYQEIASLKQGIRSLSEQQRINEASSPKTSYNLTRISLDLAPIERTRVPNIADTIPSGSFARGILVNGIDAITSLGAQSNPGPLMIRLIDDAILPRKFKGDLKDCHITIAAFGDLSSERVQGRLETLSCVDRRSGDIVETDVAGYFTGEDGRVGVRGNVVEKTRGYLEKSIVGGVLQGVAGVLNPSQNSVISPMGIFNNKQSVQDKFTAGFASGASNSMDRLSKYYIERAESIQPIIQIAAGREVDVFFTTSAQIGSKSTKEALEVKRYKQEQQVPNAGIDKGNINGARAKVQEALQNNNYSFQRNEQHQEVEG